MNEEMTPPKNTPSLADLARMPERTPLDESSMATLFGVSRRTIKRWVQNGQLPAPCPIGGQRLWTAGRLVAFVDERAGLAEVSGRRRAAAIKRGTSA